MTTGTTIADGLEFPEGPVVLPDGRLMLTEIGAGRLTTWTEADGLQPYASTGGGPNGATLGTDGSIYVTQNGGAGKSSSPPGLQRVAPDGTVSMLATEIAGLRLDAPNDLAFGPDGRLWFTDPRGDPVATNKSAGRLFAYDVLTGVGGLVIELGPVYPNGIGFLADGTLVWTESFSRRVMALTHDGPALFVELAERHFPDGFCVGADGRLFVAATYGHCVDIIEGGAVVDSLACGDGMPTNCCFFGSDLIVTESRWGTLWRYPDVGSAGGGGGGLALHSGRTA